MSQERIIGYLKALSDETRFEIVGMLKSGTLCACKILEKFSMTQPTLSYHMKTLVECGLVDVEKDWKWNYYSLNKNAFMAIKECFDFDIPPKPKNNQCKE